MKSFLNKTVAFAAILACAAVVHPSAQGQAAPSDAQIAGIVQAACQVEIGYAQLAMTKSQNKEVRDHAQQMITDHSALQRSMTDLNGKLNLTPADSATSSTLKSQSEDMTARLNALNGAAFDKAYIDIEVATHQAVMATVSSILVPNAQNTELKNALQGATPVIQGHLEHARNLQSMLDAGSTSMAAIQTAI
jgi:putative membrane protein